MISGLQSTSYQGEQHRVGKGVEQKRERRQKWQGTDGVGGTGTRTAAGEAGAIGERIGGRGEKGVRWYWEVYKGYGANKFWHL